MSAEVQRKLTTILAADAEGYSRDMAADEVRTFDALHAARDVFFKFIKRHHGRVVNTAGDGLIAEFPSVVEAVQCAIEVQRELGSHDPGGKAALRFRIGIHLGDVMIDGDDLLGEGVNLAARLQTMAEPGGVLISQQVYDQVHAKLSVGFEYLGEKRPKNFPEDVSVYRVSATANQRGAARSARQARPPRTAEHSKPTPEDLRKRIMRHAIWLGALWILIVAIDLATGEPFWAHWPGIAMATLVAWQVPALFVRGRYPIVWARGLVIVGALSLINLFTWSGYPWVLWVAAALIAVEFIRRFAGRPH